MSAHSVIQQRLCVNTRGRGFTDITAQVDALVAGGGAQTRIANLFAAHTSRSLLISENADPAVRRDLERWCARAVPDGDALYEHDDEGPDDMPSHVRSALTGVSLTVPASGGRLRVGTWQAIYRWERRTEPHQRTVVVTTLGC